MAGKLEIPGEGSFNKTEDPKIKKALETLNGLLDANNLIPNSALSEFSKSKFTWYTPKIIATEESRTNTAFGTLTTPDEIKSVVLPENGLIAVFSMALVKSSVGGAGAAAIFLGSNELVVADEEGAPSATLARSSTVNAGTFEWHSSMQTGLKNTASAPETGGITTGQALGKSDGSNSYWYGGPCYIFAAAGTYDISIQYKATSGSITAKERKLWVAVLG